MKDNGIFPAQKDDSLELFKLETECFALPWSQKSLEGMICDGSALCYVFRCDGVCVGYIGAYIVCDEAMITNIAVTASKRRLGIATKLLSTLESVCRDRGLSKITLEVRSSNDAARSLYEKLGFINVGVRPKYYTKPCEDAVLMDKSLDNSLT